MKCDARFLGLLFLAALIGLNSWAGTQNATIIGSVYSSGIGVAGVMVRLINASIGFSQAQISSTDGAFTFSNVPPAENYVISVEKSGFSMMILTSITVQVGEEKLVLPPFLLQPAAQPSPQTSAQPPQTPGGTRKQAPKAPSIGLELLSTTQSGVLDSRAVHTLPLVNRDFIDLALLVPGTYPVEQGSVLQGASLVVNGARADMNNFLLDGADNNDYTINQSLPFQIVEAMQEFRVQASTSNAEYGRSGGAQINIVSRSGSNSLHGELFEFNRNSALDAGNYFSAYSGGTFHENALTVAECSSPSLAQPCPGLVHVGNPLTDPTLAALYDLRKPRVNQNQFGGNIGGPLLKGKLFGFFNWESFRLANPRPLFEQVPALHLRNPSTCPTFLMGYVATQSCDPTALALYKLYPTPNVPVTPFTDPNSFNTDSIGQASNSTDSDSFLERVDWRVTPRVNMSFKHNILQIDQVQGGNTPATANYPGNGAHVTGRNQNVSYNYVQQWTPRTTNEFRFGWNRFRLTTTALDASINPTSLGFQNLNFTNQGLPTVTVGGGLPFSFGPYSSLGSNFATPSNRADTVFSLANNFNLIRGRHNWKFGGEFRDIRLNVDNRGLGRGVLGFFFGPFEAGTGTPELASIARICPQALILRSPHFYAQPCSQFGKGFARNFSTRSFDGYVQDQWRPWQNFTVNYGIRYEVNTAPVELHNRLVNFYPSHTLGLTGLDGGLVQGGGNTAFDSFGNILQTDLTPAPRAGFNTDTNNLGPRFGFAWDPRKDGRISVRGSYALVFDQQSLQPSVNMLLNPPFVQQSFSAFPHFKLGDTFSVCSSGVVVGDGCFTTSSNASSDWGLQPYSVTAIDPHNKSPYLHQFHFGLELQVSSEAALELAYVGSAGHRLPLLRDLSLCNAAKSLVDPLNCFNQNDILDQDNVGNSNFNSLQVRFETRNFHGLQLRTFYLWAKSIDNASSLQPQVFLASSSTANSLIATQGTINPESLAGVNNISPTLSLQSDLPVITTRPRLPQDSNNLAGERSLSDFDIRHRFVLSYTYAVPRWAPHIGTGWQLAGNTTVQSGQPFTVYADLYGTPFRPNVSGPVAINTNDPLGAININDFNDPLGAINMNDFNSSSVTGPQPRPLGRNAFTGPKFVNFDFALVKDTHLSDRTSLQFRAEFFNLFNNVNFRQPYSRVGEVFNDDNGQFASISTNCTSRTAPSPAPPGLCFFRDPFFGQILQAFPARQIQFALKLVF
jgi:hypothetical protein